VLQRFQAEVIRHECRVGGRRRIATPPWFDGRLAYCCDLATFTLTVALTLVVSGAISLAHVFPPIH
jgi:hypothetical protein